MSFPQPESELPPQVYWAARLEDAVAARINRALRRRGWEPRILTYTGYGTQEWGRVLARVLLTPPGTRTRDVSGARGWRRFVAATAPGVPVTVEVGGRVHQVTSGRGGYVDEVLAGSLEPGWAQALLSAAGSSRPAQVAPLRVVADGPGVGLVSDIDDTVVITALPRPLLAFWNTFLRHETSRRPVPGMAAMYEAVLAADPSTFVVYLSTGAWNVAPSLREFLARFDFPRGPLLLTDWGPTTQAMFRSGSAHKRDQLHRLFTELPQLRWLLVGDDGQHDPQVYGEAAQAAPDRVEAVLIRQLSPTEQVLTHGSPDPLTTDPAGAHPAGAHPAGARPAGAHPAGAHPAGADPVGTDPAATRTTAARDIRAPDGTGLLRQLRDRGLLRPHARTGP